MSQEHKSTGAQEHRSTGAQELELSLVNKVLQENIATIRTVSEWGALMGYSNSNLFALHYRKVFAQKCKQAMVKIRLEKAIQIMRITPSAKCFEVANQIGLPNELALYKYFKRHLHNSPTFYRKTDKENG